MPVDPSLLAAVGDLATPDSDGRLYSAAGPVDPGDSRGGRPTARVRLSPQRRRLLTLAAGSVAAGVVCGLVLPTSADAGTPTAAPAASTIVPSSSSAGASTTTGATVRTSPRRTATPRRATPVGPAAPTVVRPLATASAAAPVQQAPALRSLPEAATVLADGRSPFAPTATAAATAPTVRGAAVAAVTAVHLVADPRPPHARPVVVAPAYRPTRPLPADSGQGRRIVYTERGAHLWIVGADGTVLRDYPVTGRIGRPRPQMYHVYSKSPTAVNPGEKLRFDLMVRFAYGITGARIGFHTIPRSFAGVPIQGEDQLGRAIGAGGCVRQKRSDAEWLYTWVKVGDTVVVLP